MTLTILTTIIHIITIWTCNLTAAILFHLHPLASDLTSACYVKFSARAIGGMLCIICICLHAMFLTPDLSPLSLA